MKAEKYGYQFVGGNLALDLVNTVAYRLDTEKSVDHLQSTEDLRRWTHQAQRPDWAGLKHRRFTACDLSRVREVREDLFAIFHAVAHTETIPATSLTKVSTVLNECRSKQRLSTKVGGVRWTWRSDATGSDLLLDSALTEAAELLTSDSIHSVRLCAGEGCGWLFLDRSNARKRRWCRMADCGNRSKAREHYKRRAGANVRGR